MIKTVDAARGKWPGIFVHFGVDQRFLNTKKHTECPFCGGKDRFRFSDHQGSGNYFCNQCAPDGGTAFDFLIQWTGKEFRELAKEIDSIVGNIEYRAERPKGDPIKRLKRLEAGVVSMDGINPVRKYLKTRGLQPTPAMQFNPAVDYYEDGRKVGTYPAMLCKLLSPEGSPMTYHVTYLTQGGEKAPVSNPRKLMTAAGDTTGAAIRLFPIAETIGVAEGIETALAVHKLFGIPCWACVSAGMLEKFQPPEGVKTVTVFGDNDLSFTGQKAAYTLANRLMRTMPASVTIPQIPGRDFADELEQLKEGA